MKLSTAVLNTNSQKISFFEDTSIDPPQLIVSRTDEDGVVEILHCQNSEYELGVSDVANLLFKLGYSVTFEAA